VTGLAQSADHAVLHKHGHVVTQPCTIEGFELFRDQGENGILAEYGEPSSKSLREMNERLELVIGMGATHLSILADIEVRGPESSFIVSAAARERRLLQVKPKVKGGVAALVAGDSKVSGAIRSTAYDNLDVLPGNASYRDLDLVLDHAKKSEQRVAKILEQVERDYDVVILDCPPGASLVADNAVFSADAVVVPLVPSPLSMRSLEQVVEFVGASVSKARIVGFLSMVDRRKTLHRTTVEQLPPAQKAVTDVVVPATVHVERMGTERAPIGSYAPGVEAAQAYGELWALIRGAVKPKARRKKS
jgi:chromosome partitioning protein